MGDTITVDGKTISIEEWLKQEREKEIGEESREDFSGETKIPLYRKPTIKHRVRKERDGSVRYLTKDEIRKEYGMESTGKMTNTDKIIYTMLQELNDTRNINANEIIRSAGLNITKSSASGLISAVWKTLGEQAGIFSREHTPFGFVYNKEKEISFEEAKALHRKISNTMVAEKAQSKTIKTEQRVEEPKKEKEQKVEEIPTTLEDAVRSIPERIKVDVTIRVLFGFCKPED